MASIVTLGKLSYFLIDKLPAWQSFLNFLFLSYTIYSVHTLRQMGLRDVYNFDMAECRISAMESVPGIESPSSEIGLQGDSIWMGTESRRVLVYGGADAEHYQEIGCAIMSASVLHIKFHLNQVYVALANGTLAVFQRNSSELLFFTIFFIFQFFH